MPLEKFADKMKIQFDINYLSQDEQRAYNETKNDRQSIGNPMELVDLMFKQFDIQE